MSRILTKPESLFGVFARKGGAAPESTHYCPGCGHGNLHKLIAEALDDFGVADRTILISPVGCAVFAYHYFRCGNIQAAHGRAPAVATAVKRAHPEAIVLCYQGDGDLAAIGAGNILHAAARGEPFTVFFVNNAIYGMTGGQMAPTTLLGQRTTTTPEGRTAPHEGFPLRVSELLATLDAPAYIERCALGSTKQLLNARAAVRRAIRAQIDGRGFSLVEVLSPCPAGWHTTPAEARERVADEMVRAFPLGVFRDRKEAAHEPGPAPTLLSPAQIRNALAGRDAEAEIAPVAQRLTTTHRIILAGFGGQGVLHLGTALAHLGMKVGANVSWLPSYGPEMRGGTANCHVVLSPERIGAPVVCAPDVLVALTEPALQKFGPRVRSGGLIVYDASFSSAAWQRDDVRLCALPLARIAHDAGHDRGANMVALGALNGLLGLFDVSLVEAEVRAHGDDALAEANVAAVRAGGAAVTITPRAG